jgi:hypothetical protein
MGSKAENQNAREFSRSRVCVKSEVRLNSGILLEGEVRDVSMNGIWFATERLLPIGNKVRVHLLLKGGGENRIETEGEVVRVDDGGIAINFTTIDAGSIEHLRNLVLYNADDIDQADREFQEHVGLKKTDNW